MKTLYVIELDGIPIEVTAHASRAAVLATERKVPGKRLRVQVVRHWYYEDEIDPIHLDWNEPEDTNPQLNLSFMEMIDNESWKDIEAHPSAGCAAGTKSDCGCTDSTSGFPERCG